MEWLTEWLKSVIVVVMFAAFVELLLPGKSMERYARLVLSLLILLALLKPIIGLFYEAPEPQLAERLEAIEKGIPPGSSLEKILAQAEVIHDMQQKQSLQWAAEQAALEMKHQIAAETGEEPESVTVALKFQGDPASSGQGGAAVESVKVKLKPRAAADGHQKADPEDQDGAKPVDPVQIEKIQVSITETRTGEEPVLKEKPAEEDDPEFVEQARAVKALLGANWRLTDEQISVSAAEQFKT
ncbi:stage III sporulation protein AF [Paenibacillus lemnae]|uniref:Stage III sporulation protein AF n=1 Tax=Paenibacillus lemnae TaxID=1330551 RepID=A0A848M7B7_PAELE|nr:stage III sporulation protein AF [Paenibacillus lemnae]NMO96877.1 stage III sporulation protein AF [Paenibacillus lemnae]